MSEVTDLDVVVPEPKTVRFGGKEYEVPADIPMEIFLRINLAGDKMKDDGSPDQIGQFDALIEAIGDLFCFELEERSQLTEELRTSIRAEVRAVLMRRGVRYTFQLISNIYKDDEVEGEPTGEGEDQALIAASNGTRSSSTSESPTTPQTAHPAS